MAAPTVEDVAAYLGDGHSWTEDEITAAYTAELAAQRAVCKTPADADPWPDDLAEALFRRVAHNLAVRALPLGYQANLTETSVATTRVGGTDAEVRRLEAPHRKRIVG